MCPRWNRASVTAVETSIHVDAPFFVATAGDVSQAIIQKYGGTKGCLILARATKTIHKKLEYKKPDCFTATQELFNRVARFYFNIIQEHPYILELNQKRALTALERRTVQTKDNPTPVRPLPFQHVPAMFRRAAINTAYGSARSFFSNLKKYKEKKAEVEARGKKYKRRPPVPPREWNKKVVFYAGMIKDMDKNTVMLKLYTGKAWVWMKFKHTGRDFPEGWKVGSPHAVIYKNRLELHFPVEKNVKLTSISKQIQQNPNLRVCAVDLNMDGNHAVCTILSSDGTQGRVQFIHGNKALHHRRKRLLGKIAVKRSQHNGLLEDDDNKAHWKKIRDIEGCEAHRVSRRIVKFALENEATVIVFENLKNLTPVKGKYSRRSNTKRAYWLKGKIQDFTGYKAKEHRILVSIVNPRNTSRNCFYCDEQVSRYKDVPDGYTVGAPLFLCSNGHKGNADVNASWNIGKKFFLKHSKPGKKLPGVAAFHAAEKPEGSNGPVALPGSSVRDYGPNEVAATPQILRDTPTLGST